MRDRVCIVTGATSGIGRATAMELARRGARVAVHGRSPEKCDRTAAAIRAETGSDDVETFVADLACMDQIRTLADALIARYPSIHVLVNNAGLLNTRFTETVDGIETTLAVNHLAPFLLTNLLLDRLKSGRPARIVNVASEAYRLGTLDLDDPEYRRRGYRSLQAYGSSKLMNLQFTFELARRLEGSGVTANALHPGVVSTGLGSNNPDALVYRMMRFARFMMRTPERGAATSLFLACDPSVEGVSGRYWLDCREKRASAVARDPDLQRRLWALSQQMTGLA